MSQLKFFRMCDNYVFSWGVVFAAATAERAAELYEAEYGEPCAAGFPVLIEGDLLNDQVSIEAIDDEGEPVWFAVTIGKLLQDIAAYGDAQQEGEVLGPDDTHVDNLAEVRK